jgi:DNA-directed RNA polymerase specialized sigma24 family protein
VFQPAPVAPDRSIVSRIAQGDVGAVRELEQRHGTTLYAIAYGTLLDPDAADLLVTSVFAEAVAGAASALTNADCVFAWLVGMVRRRLADHPAPLSHPLRRRSDYLRLGLQPLSPLPRPVRL